MIPTEFFYSSGDNYDLAGKNFCALLGGTTVSLIDPVSRDDSTLIFFTLLEIITILLEDQNNFCALLGGTTVLLLAPSPEMIPT